MNILNSTLIFQIKIHCLIAIDVEGKDEYQGFLAQSQWVGGSICLLSSLVRFWLVEEKLHMMYVSCDVSIL